MCQARWITCNPDKTEYLIKFHGSNSFTHMNMIKDKVNNIVINPTYLGSRLFTHPERRTNMPEIQERCKAMHIAWECHKGLWHAQGALRPRLLVFSAIIYEAALSGLTAYAIRTNECRALDKRILAYGRRLMRGNACKKEYSNGNTSYHAQSNFSVWKFLKIVPTFTELRVRRLRWWQQIVSFPDDYSGFIAAMFGTYRFDVDSPINEDGTIHESANDWILQFRDDLIAMGDVDGANEISVHLADHVLDVFKEPWKTEFLAIDFKQIRYKYLRIAIPPNATCEDFETIMDAEEDDGQYVCEHLLKDESICGMRFDEYQKLKMHQARSLDHKIVRDETTFILTNVCCWCNSVFASRETARNHAIQAFKQNYCRLDRGSPFNVVKEVDYICRACDDQPQFENMYDYHAHVRQHRSPPEYYVFDTSQLDASQLTTMTSAS